MNVLTTSHFDFACSFLNLMNSSLSFLTVIYFHKPSAIMPMRMTATMAPIIAGTNRKHNYFSTSVKSLFIFNGE